MLLELLDRIRHDGLAQAKNDHDRETITRAYDYAKNRIAEGTAMSDNDVKMAFSGFADGFCTGFHRGSGTTCHQ